MQHETQVAIISRILAHLRSKTTDVAAQSHRQPARTYWCPDHHRDELAHVLRRHPILACHASTLAEPGGYITIECHGVPLLITRTRDGRLAAFLNVCRHRGARVATEARGRAKCFVCPYHAWTYSTDGQLLHIPHSRGFADFEPTQRSLVAVPVVERHGCIWICADRTAELDIDAHLGPLGSQLAELDLGRHLVHEQYEQVTAMNWKLVIDGFLEAYHIRSTHSETFYGVVFDNLALHDHYDRHSRTIYPLRKIQALQQRDVAQWDLRRVASLIYHVFPSTIIAVEPYHVSIFDISSIDAAHSRIRATVLVTPEKLCNRAKLNEDIHMLKAGLAEDYVIGESIQAGFAAGANEHLHFGLFEGTLAHFHRSLEGAIAGMARPAAHATAPTLCYQPRPS
jgi:phenylpropionate dioxygenase-like ring-hydroxylating dioxygenase large terminal subunit